MNCISKKGLRHKVSVGHGGSDGSYEYLVFRSTLLGAAARHGLHPIIDYDEPALDQLFQPVRIGQLSDTCPMCILDLTPMHWHVIRIEPKENGTLQVDRKQPCKHFNPRFPATGDHILDASLKQASKLNMAFCFQKRSSSKAVPQNGAAAGRTFCISFLAASFYEFPSAWLSHIQEHPPSLHGVIQPMEYSSAWIINLNRHVK